MYMKLVLLLAAAFFALSHQSVDMPPPIEVHLTTLDVEVNEEENTRTDLGGGPIVSCGDEDETRAYIKSVTPSSPCGIRCFQLQPCAMGVNGSEYCLYYYPGQGSLSATAAPTHTITVGCTDDVEAEAVDSFTVTTIPNMPPTFAAGFPASANIDGSSTAANADLINVAAVDADGDALFYTLATNPSTPLLEIGYTDGMIRSTDDLKLLCEDSIQATVTATDMHNRAIGPRTIDITIDNANQPPSVTNLDTTITVDENVGVGTVVHTLDVVDDGIGTIVYHMRSTSNAGLEMYELVGQEVRLRIDPDYERSDTRSTRLYFDLSDGYCNSKTYSLIINIDNVNEPPMYTPDSIMLTVYEGNVREDLLRFVDEDFGDTHTHTRQSGTTLFDIDPVTGELFSPSEIDIDNNVEFRDYRLTSRVTDAGGEMDTSASFTVRVLDANDQPPYFLANSYSFGVTECTEPGTVVGNVAGDDDDSSFQNNDVFYFGGGGGKLAVLSDGSVVLTQAMVDGEISSGSATITDQGLVPGPLSGTPATVTVTAGPCPPPVTPAPPAPGAGGGGTGGGGTGTGGGTTTAAPATTNSTGSGGGGGDDGAAALLGWLIPAILLGSIWLALTSFFIYRYVCPVRNPFRNVCKRRPKPLKVKPAKPPPPPPKVKPPPKDPPKPVQPRNPPPPKKPPTPPPPPKQVIPPPPPPQPEPDPYLFGFWKERYTDQDILSNKPQRDAQPVPIENMPKNIVWGNQPAPENLKLGPPTWPSPRPGNSPYPDPIPPPPNAQKSKCTIL